MARTLGFWKSQGSCRRKMALSTSHWTHHCCEVVTLLWGAHATKKARRSGAGLIACKLSYAALRLRLRP